MNRIDAEETARRFARTHSDRATYRWLVRQDADGEWIVVKVALASGEPGDPLKGTTGSESKPTEPDHPRHTSGKNLGRP
jgi:hypothetical protein